MTALIVLAAVWLLTLALWVVLKLRQTKLAYPAPPDSAHPERRQAA
jgi:uncharacterized membrane protein YecN with MAPEG domain